MNSEILHPSELDEALISEWERLRTTDPLYQSPFYSPHFTLAVGQARSDARVAILQQDGAIVGFLPFHLVNKSIGKPIGGQINDYHGPVMAAAANISQDALLKAAGLSAYDFNHLPVAMTTLAQGAKVFSDSPQMDLSKGYEACIENKGSSWSRAHSTMRRKWRKTEREIGPIRFEFHDPSDDIFAEHTAMVNERLSKTSGRQEFGSGWEGKVIDIVRAAKEPEFAGVMSTLHAGDRLIAAHFGMRSGSMWHWWFPSYDPSLGNLSPGMSLLDQCAQSAEANGISTIDFGRGTERYKKTFADSSVPLCEGSITRNGSVAAGLRWASRGLSSACEQMPIGRFKDVPRRALARMVFGITLPAQASLDGSH